MKGLVEFINEAMLHEAVDKWDVLFKKYFGNDYKKHLKVKTKVFDENLDNAEAWADGYKDNDWLLVDIGGNTDTIIYVAVKPLTPTDKAYAEKAIKSLEEADEDEIFDIL